MLRPLRHVALSGALLSGLLVHASSAPVCDLSLAQIVLSATASPVERQAAAMLEQEVRARTMLDWPIRDTPHVSGCRVVLADRAEIAGVLDRMHLHAIDAAAVRRPEAFAIRIQQSSHAIVILGADDRGVLFGTGYLLRHLAMTLHHVAPIGLADIDSAPAYPIRGHQLGYRPKNNTFDAWTPAQFEQYIRDLAIFGANTIEIIPPRSDDAPTSPLFSLPPLRMMVELSRILDRYGLDCSIWYPALDKDYSDPATIKAAVAEWGAVFDQLPRIDAIFVPGGDPGHTEPKYLFALLEQQAVRLRQKHPHAQVWISPQSFSAQWLDEFYALLAHNPAWLTGVVYGPEMRDSPEQFRRRVPARFPIRFYPDITHTLDAQYPVPNWDPAFALTEGREPVNPRPADESILFHRYASLTTGFVAYSEGSNDDINKVLWSAWGWDPRQSAHAILAEYTRLFISPAQSDTLATVITGLEANWRGPVQSNRSIEPTLARLRAVEQQNPTLVRENWRLQQLLYRASYDAFIQQRARREQASERIAIRWLTVRPLTDTDLRSAMNALAAPEICSTSPLCRRLSLLAEDLFRTIGMQLSVTKYHALATDRGANLDRVDESLSNTPWLRTEIAKALGEPDAMRRQSLVAHTLELLGRSGTAQQDILGETGRAPHLVAGKSFDQDPSGLHGTCRGVKTGPDAADLPLAWRTFAGTLYDQPLELHYEALQPHRDTTIRVHSPSDLRHLSLRVNGTPTPPVCADEQTCSSASYHVPADLLPTRAMHLAFFGEQGRGGNGRAVAISTVTVDRAPNSDKR